MQIENSRPRQSERSETDRNEILAILAETGMLPGPGIEGLIDRLSREGRER